MEVGVSWVDKIVESTLRRMVRVRVQASWMFEVRERWLCCANVYDIT